VRESNWGKTGNKKLNTWALDRIYQYLAYKGESRGVEVVKENEWNTSKTCSRCEDDTKSNGKHRGLYVCSSCGSVGNADCNGAESMRQKISPSPHGEDRNTSPVAQASVHLFDSESGVFAPREQVVSYTGEYPTCGTGSPAVHDGEDVTTDDHSGLEVSRRR
jgi:putative transposase